MLLALTRADSTLPVALPSPPRGVSSVRRSLLVRVRQGLASAITPESVDGPAYCAIAGTVFPVVDRVVTSVLGMAPLDSFLWLTRIEALPVYTVLVVAQLLGFASRAPTARLLAATTATFMVVGLAYVNQVVGPAVMPVAGWLWSTALTTTVVLWCVRAVRHWLVAE